MHKYSIILVWLVGLSLNAQTTSQYFFESYKSLLDASATSVDISEEVMQLMTNSLSQSDFEQAAKIAGNYSVVSYRKDDLGQAIEFAQKEVSIYKEVGKKDSSLIKANYRLGVFFKNNDQLRLGVPYLKEAVEIFPPTVHSGYAYGILAQYYEEEADYDKAADALRKAILILKKFKITQQVIGKSLDLVRLYEIAELPDAREQSKQILDTLEKKKSDFVDYNYFAFYTALGNYHNKSQEIDVIRARNSYHKVLERAEKIANQAQIKAAYTNLANLYVKVKNDSALYYLKKSLETAQTKESLFDSYLNYSTYYFNEGDLDKALDYIHKVVELEAGSLLPLYELPKGDIYKFTRRRDYFIQAISEKANILAEMGFAQKDEHKVENAVAHFEMADKLIDMLSADSNYTDSKLAVRGRAAYTYPNAIKASAYLKDFEKAFYFAEKNKAITLLENINMKDRLRELSEALQSRERHLKSEIAIAAYIMDTTAGGAQEAARSRWLQSKEDYDVYIDSLQYSGLLAKDKELDHVISLNHLQQTLTDDQVVLSYTWDTENDYTKVPQLLTIDSSGTEYHMLDTTRDLESLIQDFRSRITQPFFTQEDVQTYVHTGHDLYLALIPETVQEAIEGKKIIIVPDGDLQYIPFDALITSKADHQYFIEQNDISYVYSTSFWVDNSSIIRPETAIDFVGIAPVSFAYDSLPTLKNTTAEVVSLSQLMEGNVLLGQEATKEAFLSTFKNTKMLHLATHAQASGQPWVAFQDTKLNAAELYHLTNSADLIVLSACETALGKEARGEGVMSLSRGFFASGANSVVATLWSVNDKTTASIMKSFYEAIRNGVPKSGALRAAKLDYLSQHTKSEASPYYWASFRLVGDVESVPGISSWQGEGWLLVGGTIVLIVLILYFTRKENLTNA